MFRNNWRQLIIATGAVLLNAVGFYVILSYMPTYLSEELGFGAAESFLATTIALVTLHRLHLPDRHCLGPLRPQEDADHRIRAVHRW